jgi:hypothetical protein
MQWQFYEVGSQSTGIAQLISGTIACAKTFRVLLIQKEKYLSSGETELKNSLNQTNETHGAYKTLHPIFQQQESGRAGVGGLHCCFTDPGQLASG